MCSWRISAYSEKNFENLQKKKKENVLLRLRRLSGSSTFLYLKVPSPIVYTYIYWKHLCFLYVFYAYTVHRANARIFVTCVILKRMEEYEATKDEERVLLITHDDVLFKYLPKVNTLFINDVHAKRKMHFSCFLVCRQFWSNLYV